MIPASDRIWEPSQGDARFTLLWLHGLGATATDFSDLGAQLQCPQLRIIALQAPTQAVTLFGGQQVPSWFDIIPKTDGTVISDPDGLEATATHLSETLQQQYDNGIEACAIGGYSQGGAMALYAALHASIPLSGAVCLSGYLPQHEQLLQHKAGTPARVPLFIGHGRADDVVPYPFAEFSRDQLTELGYSVQWYSADFGHEVTAEELQNLDAFLRHIFGQTDT